jgi:transposase
MSRPIHPTYQQSLLLPPCVEDWIGPTHPVRFVRDFVAKLDLRALGFRDSPSKEGRPHIAKEVLLGVWLYGWMDRIRTLRMLEKACLDNLAYIWISGNLQPDHNTLWRFFRDNKAALKRVFKQTVLVSMDTGLVGFALHAVDGTKIRAACSDETALHRERLKQALKDLDTQINATCEAIEQEAASQEPGYAMPEDMVDPQKRRDLIDKALAALQQQDLKHLHPQEPEARMMKTRQGKHMGYNAQIAVDRDSDLIVAGSVVQDENDSAQAMPVLDEVEQTTGQVAETTVMDGGYFSGEQLAQAHRKGRNVLMPVKSDASKAKGFSKAEFRYDPHKDVYICPRGQLLKRWRTEKPSKTERYERWWYRCTNRSCPVRGQCTNDKRGRTIKRTPYDDQVEEHRQGQNKPENRALMSQRKGIVEHVFGVIKANEGFWRFTARGLAGARAQWALACTAYNIRKLYGWWLAGALA